jgi:hypothetical protein
MPLVFDQSAEDATLTVVPDELRSLLSYWESLCQGRFAPAWNEFHLDQVDPAILPRCTVVDVVDGGANYIYRFWGTARTKLLGYDLSGKSINAFRPPELVTIAAKDFATMLERRRASWFTVVASATGGPDTFTFWFLRLPFSADGTSVDKILSVNYNRHSRLELEILERYGMARRA